MNFNSNNNNNQAMRNMKNVVDNNSLDLNNLMDLNFNIGDLNKNVMNFNNQNTNTNANMINQSQSTNVANINSNFNNNNNNNLNDNLLDLLGNNFVNSDSSSGNGKGHKKIQSIPNQAIFSMVNNHNRNSSNPNPQEMLSQIGQISNFNNNMNMNVNFNIEMNNNINKQLNNNNFAKAKDNVIFQDTGQIQPQQPFLSNSIIINNNNPIINSSININTGGNRNMFNSNIQQQSNFDKQLIRKQLRCAIMVYLRCYSFLLNIKQNL